jgi:hypothetical protein
MATKTPLPYEVRELLDHVPEGDVYWKRLLEHIAGPDYQEGDETCPFFSERFLYALLGKEEARTVRALLREALVALGADEAAVRRAL